MSRLNPDNYTVLHGQTFTSGKDAIPFLSEHPCGEKIAEMADTLFYRMTLAEAGAIYLVGKGCRDIESDEFNLIVMGSSCDMQDVKDKIKSLALPLINADRIICVDEMDFLRGFTRENKITNLIFRQPSMPLYGNQIPAGEIITQKRLTNMYFDQDSTDWQPVIEDREHRFDRDYKEVWDSPFFRNIMNFYDEGFRTIHDFKVYFEFVTKKIEAMPITKADFLKGRLCVPSFIFRLPETDKPVYKLVPKFLNVNMAARDANLAYEVETV